MDSTSRELTRLVSGCALRNHPQEKMWRDQNKTLEKEIMAQEKAKILKRSASWERENHTQYSSSPPQVQISESAFTLTNMNYKARHHGEAAVEPQLKLGSSLLPPWMLNHLNG